MTWYIACICGCGFSSEDRDAQCPACYVRYWNGQPMVERVQDPKVKRQMENELNRILDLGEWGLLEDE